MSHEQAKAGGDVEKPFLLFMFFIAGSFTYGALLVYPLYQALAGAKGQEEVDSAQGGIILMVAKYLSILAHNLFSRCWTTLRGLQLQVACYLVFSALCLTVASLSFISEAATLMLVASLYFTNSNVIAGPLWPVPSEERSKIRMLFYYACCPAGCLWTALASMCLAREEYQSNWALRAAVVTLPLLATLVSWMMLPADGFWSPERMKQAQLEREQQIAEAEKKKGRAEETKKEKSLQFCEETKATIQSQVTEDGFTQDEPEERRDSFQSFGEPSAPSVRSPPSPMEGLYKARMSMMPPMPPSIEGLPRLPRLSAAARASQRRTRRRSSRGSRSSALSQERRPRSTVQQIRKTFKSRQTVVNRMSFFNPLNPALQRELGSLTYGRASVFPGRLSELDEEDQVDEPQTSPWANGRFRVLVGTHCACLYCVTFWGYSVFPMLINEQGPSLELISFFYSLEGAAQVLCTILVLPFLDSQIFLKYFSTAFLLLLSAPLAVCLLGKIHWFFYLVVLLMIDVLLCVVNALLGVVVLRSLPWDQIMVFYNIACTLGGVLSGTSFVQMPLKALLGSWELASIVGHGVPTLLLLIFYFFHLKPLGELWDLLIQPVRRTELGEWDPEDLEDEDAEDQNPPSLLTGKGAEDCLH